MTDNEPTPLDVQQSRLTEEAVRDAAGMLLANSIAPAVVGSGLLSAAGRLTVEQIGPVAAVRLLRDQASLIEALYLLRPAEGPTI